MENKFVNEAVERMREKKIRITSQRVAMLEYLTQTSEHPTAEEIFQVVNKEFPQVSVATVYNNLHLFLNLVLVKEITSTDNASRFDIIMQKHYHIICEGCQKIVDFHYELPRHVQQQAIQDSGFDIYDHQLEFYGLCQECRKKFER